MHKNYAYPSVNSNIGYYEAVAWSEVAQIADPSNPGSYILNPLFIANYPNTSDQNHIIDIFTAEKHSITVKWSFTNVNQ